MIAARLSPRVIVLVWASLTLAGAGCGRSPEQSRTAAANGAASGARADEALHHPGLQSEPFAEIEGRPVTQYILTNANGLKVALIDYGATVTSVETPDRDGEPANITLGFDTPEGWLKNPPYFGVTVGRFANRIAGGKFTLDGQEYTLAANNGPNHLHGGPTGFSRQLWHAEPLPKTADGDLGGEIHVRERRWRGRLPRASDRDGQLHADRPGRTEDRIHGHD